MSILVAAENTVLAEIVTAAFSAPVEMEVTHAEHLEDVPVIIHERRQSDRPIRFSVLDYDLSGLHGLKGVAQFANRLPHLPMALMLRGGSLELAQRAYRAGATAVVDRDLPKDDLAAALRLAQRGQFITLFSQIMHNGQNASFSDLSERELQVLRGLCDGLQNKEIAHAFSIQEVTVKMHMRAVVRKLGAKNRTHAAMIARDQNLV